jgi:hypothetical protein
MTNKVIMLTSKKYREIGRSETYLEGEENRFEP